ncbi:helix-turn-helix domain-containing protein [Deinococcus frigens]|uniref:helix-turn-helix domain-containing protein n=1 Tax=Deinococcus frigens TaxID=249403 RepID=UPI0012EBA362|nr:helix-turn-helix transcriptional regulator [Deinococcus frigens]
MNEEIRAAVDARLTEKHMSRADLARAVGKTPQAITRALNGGKDGGGQVPGIWAAILEALDLRLTVGAGQGQTGEGRGRQT